MLLEVYGYMVISMDATILFIACRWRYVHAAHFNLNEYLILALNINPSATISKILNKNHLLSNKIAAPRPTRQKLLPLIGTNLITDKWLNHCSMCCYSARASINTIIQIITIINYTIILIKQISSTQTEELHIINFPIWYNRFW